MIQTHRADQTSSKRKRRHRIAVCSRGLAQALLAVAPSPERGSASLAKTMCHAPSRTRRVAM